ncbi:Uncharacterised protein [Mycobacteroides abscessus subsp. massiliense]|nr:Uncharacterised protein [Mycobacteroides abscessus subsp. massiliense]SKT02475.1 Uncharacterised protein [Mycobacteroides abscessus subsp. massiliense]SLA26708.1 Uncharacterised protein [Mycobacteroides abscessus subsp. massiliense]SLB16145.1 Uncharacterised protein [Mycobacteroides abscessus subsp. massiliense]SLK88773.1 Uncharacterised protein [Mycobacteroides abscessus subsp. massiliense]
MCAAPGPDDTSSISMITNPLPPNRSASSAVVTTTTGPASHNTNRNRTSGTEGSIGTYAAPVFSTPMIATTASTDRENNNATRCPGPTP